MSALTGKIAVVTGGGSGIGLAVAKRFAQEGATVFVTGRRQAQLDEAVALDPERIIAIAGDVTQSADLARLFTAASAKTGQIDILVASSGVSEFATLESTTETIFDKAFNLNVRGLFFTVQSALPYMKKGSAIVLVGSIAGVKGIPGYGVYAATKAAVRSFTQTWSAELAPLGIRVNTLSPGPTETPMFDQVSEEVHEAMRTNIPLQRLGLPEEVAAAALFLASSESAFVTGAQLRVDGGMSQI